LRQLITLLEIQPLQTKLMYAMQVVIVHVMVQEEEDNDN